jgi:hypothetical protein
MADNISYEPKRWPMRIAKEFTRCGMKRDYITFPLTWEARLQRCVQLRSIDR